MKRKSASRLRLVFKINMSQSRHILLFVLFIARDNFQDFTSDILYNFRWHVNYDDSEEFSMFYLIEIFRNPWKQFFFWLHNWPTKDFEKRFSKISFLLLSCHLWEQTYLKSMLIFLQAYYCLVFILYTNKQPFPLDFGINF